jgi:Predicted membrane protein (DUF2142)
MELRPPDRLRDASRLPKGLGFAPEPPMISLPGASQSRLPHRMLQILPPHRPALTTGGRRDHRPSAGTSSRVPAILAIGFLVMVVAWGMSSRPFAGPDETAHYLRALTLANGQLVGPQAPNTLLGLQPPLSPVAQTFETANSRGVLVPRALSPPRVPCRPGRADRGVCHESTYTGNYEPVPYVLPAIALAVSGRVQSASWLARAGSAVLPAAFLALAAFLVWDGTVLSLLGLLLAVTPMVLFISSVVNPSGLEIAASIAFLSGLLRVSRDPRAVAGRIWASIALSGSMVILAWQLGPAFVVLDLAVLGAYIGRPALGTLWRGCRRQARAVAATLVGAAIAYAGFSAGAGPSPTPLGLPRLAGLAGDLGQVRTVAEQAVGDFGGLTVPMPPGVVVLWGSMIAFLFAVALASATRRQRVVLAWAGAISILFPMVSYAVVQSHTGFDLQGRYVLPVLVIVPLLSGEIIARGPQRLRAGLTRTALMVCADLAIGLQLLAWWINARAQAGPQSAWSMEPARWSPPLGWAPWAVLAVCGVVLLGAAKLLAQRSSALPAVSRRARRRAPALSP